MRVLYGREQELSAFEDALQRAELGASQVIVFYGPGGQGKTQLCAAAVALASNGKPKRPVCLIDFKTHPTNPVDALYAIRVATIKGRYLNRPIFDVAFHEYQTRFNPGVDIVRRYPELYMESGAGNRTDVILEVATSALHLPFVSVAEKYARKLTDHLAHKSALARREELALMDTWSNDEWHQKLPAFLAQDISQFDLEQGPPSIFFDHYESLWENGMEHSSIIVNIDAWIRIFCENLSRGTCAIFSRERLKHWPEVSLDWREAMIEIALSSLSARDSLRMLNAAGIAERPIRKRIVSVANGHPLFLAVQIETYRSIRSTGRVPQPRDFGKLRRDVISRFVDHMDPKDGEALKVLSIPESFDADTFEYLSLKMPNAFFGLAFESVSAYSFIQVRENETAVMHSVMRSGLQEICDARVKRRTHETLFLLSENRWYALGQKDTPAALSLFRTSAWHKLHCDEVDYVRWVLSFPPDMFSRELHPEVEKARRIAERHEMLTDELECIWRVLLNEGERGALERAMVILDGSRGLAFDGQEFLRAMHVEQAGSSGERYLELCAATACRPGFLPGLDEMWRASFYRCWALAALSCDKAEEYQLHQEEALAQLRPESQGQRRFFILLVYEMVNFLLSKGKFDALRSVAAQCGERLERSFKFRGADAMEQPKSRTLKSTYKNAVDNHAEENAGSHLQTIAKRSTEDLDRNFKAFLRYPDESAEESDIEMRQLLPLPGLNIGLVVNARGKLCMVYDQRFPAPGPPQAVLYDPQRRLLTIAFALCPLAYQIDWEASDDMHSYVMKCARILLIMMQDRKPIEGFDCTLLHVELSRVQPQIGSQENK